MGPQGFSVNAIDPILVFNGHDGILQVRINSEAQNGAGVRPAPFEERKGAGPARAPMRSALSLVESNQMYINIYRFTVFLQKIPQSKKLTCAANTSHSNEVADFEPEPGDNLLIFLRTSNTGVDHPRWKKLRTRGCYPLRRVCGPGRPLARKDGPRDHFCWPAGALLSAVFLTMPPIEGKRARTCLACANALCVVCPQRIDCARARWDQTLHGLRVASDPV